MRQIVSSAFATAAPARVVGAGAKTKELVDKVHALMKRYRIKPTAFYVADNLSRLQFKGTFGRDVKAKDVKRFGGLGGKPVVLDVTVSPGRQVWVEITAWKGKTSISLALPKRDLGTTFAVVQRAVQRLLDDVLARQVRAAQDMLDLSIPLEQASKVTIDFDGEPTWFDAMPGEKPFDILQGYLRRYIKEYANLRPARRFGRPKDAAYYTVDVADWDGKQVEAPIEVTVRPKKSRKKKS